ncbi:MAG: hypothetical protein E5W83_29060 [Mesorhizobium sp.]|nr:MAG: hypothetical protein E5W83_29060 [Mesorhizobium sp.]
MLYSSSAKVKALRLWRAAWERSGVQIVTMAQLAARLACGFTHPARSQDLDPAIRAALETRDFAEFESVRELAGVCQRPL